MEEKIIDAAIAEFQKKGLKFTMDDIAKALSVSKKTIYTVFPSKEALLEAMMELCFADIKRSEATIALNETLDITEKLRRVLIAMPDRYRNIGLSQLGELAEKYPAIYEKVRAHLTADWEVTISLLKEAARQGAVRSVSIPIFQLMLESTIEGFLSGSTLTENGISYEDAMEEMSQILINGIRIPGKEA